MSHYKGWALMARTVLGVYDWKYALVPVGVSLGETMAEMPDRILLYRWREVCIFGFRVARWVVDIRCEYKHGTDPLDTPS